MEEKINLLVPKLEIRKGGLPRMSRWLNLARTGDRLRNTAKASRDYDGDIAEERDNL